MLVIQDPTNASSAYLLESLLDAFDGAERIAGAFAFASRTGIHLLTSSERFRAVATRFPVELIVGIDAVTNEHALDSLAELQEQYPNVLVSAFLNPRPETLFHPKFCWTKTARDGRLITGSGNLTEGGLLGHWEAYSIEHLSQASVASVETTWNGWKARHNLSLLPVNHHAVRQRAKTNHVMAVEGDLPALVAAPPSVSAEPLLAQPTEPAPVLLAEIPRSGDRWNQVNFHIDDYVGFFGAQEGTSRLLVLRQVRNDGSLADYEEQRPTVTVASRNFRIELAAAAGRDYPPVGRPIGIYVRVATRAFYYLLLMPDDPQFSLATRLLDRQAITQPQRMRTLRSTVADLRRDWPTAPFWNLLPTET